MGNNYYYELVNFVRSTSLYPPSELCSGTYGKKAASKEKRLIEICEDLYRLDNQTLPAMREAFKDFDSMTNMGRGVMIKTDTAARVAGKLIFFTDRAIKALEVMHKKDPALQCYYSGFKISRQGAEDVIREWTLDLQSKSEYTGSEVQNMITDAVKAQKESYK